MGIAFLDMELIQPENGYRFSVDAFLLAAFAKQFNPKHFCDMGAGCGVVSWQLHQLLPSATGVAVEIQPVFKEFGRTNLAGTGISFLCRDIRDLPRQDRKFDLLISNPPYFKVGHGKLSKNPVKAQARHRLNGSVSDWCSSMNKHLKEDGGVCIIYPSRYAAELVTDMLKVGFNLRVLLQIASFEGEEPKLDCLYFSAEPGEVRTQCLNLYREHRKRSAAAKKFLSGTLQEGIFL
ncbi:MAG: hypothetical protein CSA81_04885 [Acidobacteria bacterium]|nr:MAG: hypothetical protein CSA81_04885 [Acidobacteriota bacterium]